MHWFAFPALQREQSRKRMSCRDEKLPTAFLPFHQLNTGEWFRVLVLILLSTGVSSSSSSHKTCLNERDCYVSECWELWAVEHLLCCFIIILLTLSTKFIPSFVPNRKRKTRHNFMNLNMYYVSDCTYHVWQLKANFWMEYKKSIGE